MDCRDLERLWNERLDERDTTPDALDAHAAACPTCLAIDSRYRALSQAIRSPATMPGPPAGFADRVLAASSRDVRPILFRLPARPGALAAAAVVAAVALGLSARSLVWKVPDARPGEVTRVRAIDPKDLTEALALAGAATWDLAREASAPAARVGRQVLDSAALPAGTSPTLSLPVGMGMSREAWQSVGDRVNAGAGPLEGTARHAFGFLLGASVDDERPPARPAEGA